MKRTWSDDQIAELKRRYPIDDTKDIARDLGKTIGMVKARANGLGITKGPNAKNGRHKWTDTEVQYLKDHYPATKTEEIAEQLHIKIHHIYHKATQLKINKSKEFMATEASGRLQSKDSRGRLFRFPKGHVPANKGKKWEDYLAPEIQERSRKTTFKKGQLPINTKHDGAISLRPEHKQRNPDKLVYWIRIAKAKWVPLHRHIWEQANGPIPKGMLIAFKDGNSQNCVIENLEMITMKDNRIRNAGHTRLPDSYVAHIITTKSRKPDKEAAKEILEKHPKLIEAKRSQLLLNKTLKKVLK